MAKAEEVLSVVRYWLPHVRILEPIEFQQQLDAGLAEYLAGGQFRFVTISTDLCRIPKSDTSCHPDQLPSQLVFIEMGCTSDGGFMDWTADLTGLLLLVAGSILGMKARKRKFDRTNPHGIERFPTYMTKVASKAKDYVLNGSSIMLLTSGTLLLAYNHMDTWGWIVWLPIGLFMLFILIGS